MMEHASRELLDGHLPSDNGRGTQLQIQKMSLQGFVSIHLCPASQNHRGEPMDAGTQIIQAVHGDVQLPSPFNLMFLDPLPVSSPGHEAGNILTYTFRTAVAKQSHQCAYELTP
jgi:hypothetical protein